MELARSDTDHKIREAEIMEQSMQARMIGLKWSVWASVGAVAAMIAAFLSK